MGTVSVVVVGGDFLASGGVSGGGSFWEYFFVLVEQPVKLFPLAFATASIIECNTFCCARVRHIYDAAEVFARSLVDALVAVSGCLTFLFIEETFILL